MDISHFDFDLPQELIASRPIQPRNISRLLIGSCLLYTSDAADE